MQTLKNFIACDEGSCPISNGIDPLRATTAPDSVPEGNDHSRHSRHCSVFLFFLPFFQGVKDKGGKEDSTWLPRLQDEKKRTDESMRKRDKKGGKTRGMMLCFLFLSLGQHDLKRTR